MSRPLIPTTAPVMTLDNTDALPLKIDFLRVHHLWFAQTLFACRANHSKAVRPEQLKNPKMAESPFVCRTFQENKRGF
jgi:hypothetical protein